MNLLVYTSSFLKTRIPLQLQEWNLLIIENLDRTKK